MNLKPSIMSGSAFVVNHLVTPENLNTIVSTNLFPRSSFECLGQFYYGRNQQPIYHVSTTTEELSHGKYYRQDSDTSSSGSQTAEMTYNAFFFQLFLGRETMRGPFNLYLMWPTFKKKVWTRGTSSSRVTVDVVNPLFQNGMYDPVSNNNLILKYDSSTQKFSYWPQMTLMGTTTEAGTEYNIYRLDTISVKDLVENKPTNWYFLAVAPYVTSYPSLVYQDSVNGKSYYNTLPTVASDTPTQLNVATHPIYQSTTVPEVPQIVLGAPQVHDISFVDTLYNSETGFSYPAGSVISNLDLPAIVINNNKNYDNYTNSLYDVTIVHSSEVATVSETITTFRTSPLGNSYSQANLTKLNGNQAEILFPGKVLQADIKSTVTLTRKPTDQPGHVARLHLIDGTVLYDGDGSMSYTYPHAVDINNTPNFLTSYGTRFRNHSAKYAVLANDYDYFEYSWRGTVDQYQQDPTVTLTLVYGDQIVATKTMDGTATSVNTFQHGPFLMAPTTQGQLVQISGYVTDSRGRASEERIFTITDNNSQDILEYLRFYNYSFPTALVQAYRCLEDGTPDDENGTYVSLTATWAFSQLDYGLTTYSDGTTDGKLVIRVKPHTGTLPQDTWSYNLTEANGNKKLMLEVGLDQSIDIEITTTDFIGNIFKASNEFIPSSQVVMDFRAGGEGLAIGKRSEFNKAMEVAWDSTFYGDVTFMGNVNIKGSTQAATTADAVTYYDTHNIGARTVQLALDALALKTGVSPQQVQELINQTIRNLDIPDDDHINELIITKINNIAFPPSITEARALELIANELANFNPGIDEERVNELIDEKIGDFVKESDLNPYIKREEVINDYYNKSQVDQMIAGAGPGELSAENVKYGDSNVKEALDSMTTIVDSLPDQVDQVGQEVENNGGKIDAIMIMLQNMGQSEFADGNIIYF